jgi:hypothetical protein
MNVAMHFNAKSEIVDDEAHHEMTINCQNQFKKSIQICYMYQTRKRIQSVSVSDSDKWN